jgi:hypothetical protein
MHIELPISCLRSKHGEVQRALTAAESRLAAQLQAALTPLHARQATLHREIEVLYCNQLSREMQWLLRNNPFMFAQK